MQNPSVGVWLTIVGSVATTVAAIVAKFSYDKGKAATPASPAPSPAPSDAVLERQEGAFQERVGSMLKQLADAIREGNAAHRADLREELQGIAGSMRDSAQAMRAVVDEVIHHSAQAEPAIAASVAMLPLVRQIQRNTQTAPRRRRPAK